MAQPIQILVSNQRGFIWDIRDVQTLRVQHHICGILSGTLPQVGQQNVFLGLPLMLLPEEVVLLVKNKIAVLVDELAAHKPVTTEQADTYATQRESAILAQRTEHRRLEEEKKARALELYADKIGKKQKQREEKKKLMELEKEKLAETAAGGNERLELFVPNVAEGETTTGPPPSQTHNVHKRSQQPLSSTPYTIIIQPSSADMPWYDSSAPDVVKATLEEARECGLWHYPTDALQSARCRVFEDLWRQGYFMGGGLRFGGDFLVYPGDPLRYHSHFTLTVLSSPQTSIMPLDLVAYGRLATAVKKAHLLASWNEETQEAEYLSLEWAAFG